MNNKIFVIEGTDGSGKQTQSKLLEKDLKRQGLNVLSQSFPNYDSPSSEPIKMYLSGQLSETANGLSAYQASSLFAVDRLCTIFMMRRFACEQNIYIFDRYVESNMLHQAGKIEDRVERDVFLTWLQDFEYNTLKLPRPTKVIFLDMPPQYSIELAHKRANLKSGNTKDIHEQDSEHLKNAYNAGKYVAQKFNWVIVNCINEQGKIKSIEEIHKEIMEIVNPYVKHLENNLSK